jgi:FlaA1/EpsC-like NDP-sugar epimerase
VNRVVWSKAHAPDAFDLMKAVLVATVVTLALGFLLEPGNTAFVLLASTLALSGFLTARYRSRLITGLASRLLRMRFGATAAYERALIVGADESGQLVAWFIQNSSYSNKIRVIGYVDDDLYKRGLRISGIKVIGFSSDIPKLVREHDVGVIAISIHNIDSKLLEHILELCRQTPARFVMLPDVFGLLDNAMLRGEPWTGQHQSHAGARA